MPSGSRLARLDHHGPHFSARRRHSYSDTGRPQPTVREVIGCAIEKSVERLEYVYVSQMLTYLKATGKRLGLILNFNVPVMKAGVRRVAL
jgi:hypothetical protein